MIYSDDKPQTQLIQQSNDIEKIAEVTDIVNHDKQVLVRVVLNHPVFPQDKLSNRSESPLAKEIETKGRPFILRQLYSDAAYLLSEPDFDLVVGCLGLAPSVFYSAFKHESPEFTELWGPSTFADNYFEVGETVGNGAFPVLVSVTSWGFGKIVGLSRLREFGSDLFRAQVMNGIFTTALKISINRTRPDGAPYSYPSGHTSAAFTTAGVIYAHFGKTWGTAAFVFAGYVGLSRLQEGKHYVSDVIAGGILGSYISLTLTRKDRNKGPISVAPLIINKRFGLSLNFKF